MSTDPPDAQRGAHAQPASSALVTGATGFVGRALAVALLARGWTVRVLVRDQARLDAPLARECQITVGDLSDHAALRTAVDSVDVVFHCAANVNTWDSYEAYYEPNVAGVSNLLAAIRGGNATLRRYVHVSTVDVYGYPEAPATEDSPTDGAGFGYGETKLLGEDLARRTCTATGIPFVILRPGNVIGPGSQFVERIGAELSSGLMLTIDRGRANAGLLHVDNLVTYLIWSATAREAVNQCFNARDVEDVSWSEFIDRFKRGIQGRGVVINLPFWLADAVARVWRIVHVAVDSRTEPLLHPLLIRIFGRTCGHSVAKLRRAYAGPELASFDDAMRASIAWFTESVDAKKR